MIVVPRANCDMKHQSWTHILSLPFCFRLSHLDLSLSLSLQSLPPHTHTCARIDMPHMHAHRHPCTTLRCTTLDIHTQHTHTHMCACMHTPHIHTQLFSRDIGALSTLYILFSFWVNDIVPNTTKKKEPEKFRLIHGKTDYTIQANTQYQTHVLETWRT